VKTVTVNNKLDKEDNMQHLTENLQNFITDRQGVVLLRVLSRTDADFAQF
jgi:hypothetical protein